MIQCTFCLQVNLVEEADGEPRCKHCGLELNRVRVLFPEGAATVPSTSPPAPELLAAPVLAADPSEWAKGGWPPAHAPAQQMPPSAEFLQPGDSADATQLVDRTVYVPRRPQLPEWVLELEDGRVFELNGDDIVVGRRPAADDAATLLVPDEGRTISKSHARLRRHGDTWTIEDLGSANGTLVRDSDGIDREIPRGVATVVTEYLQLGTTRTRLRRGAESDSL